jgi:hypothetical protein
MDKYIPIYISIAGPRCGTNCPFLRKDFYKSNCQLFNTSLMRDDIGDLRDNICYKCFKPDIEEGK